MKNLAQRRNLFFSMYNYYVEKDMRFLKEEYVGFKDIKSVFETKIDSLLKKDYTDADIASKNIMQAYHDNKSYIPSTKPNLPVAKLINFIYRQGSCSLMLDLDDMFLNLVYERIKIVNKTCDIVMGENEIIMYDKDPDVSPTLVIPIYKTIHNNSLKTDDTVTQNITIAREYLKSQKIRQIFLVFPKSDGFSKHIDLKFDDSVPITEDEYRVKMIPYSFSFCIKNQRKNKWQ